MTNLKIETNQDIEDIEGMIYLSMLKEVAYLQGGKIRTRCNGEITPEAAMAAKLCKVDVDVFVDACDRYVEKYNLSEFIDLNHKFSIGEGNEDANEKF